MAELEVNSMEARILGALNESPEPAKEEVKAEVKTEEVKTEVKPEVKAEVKEEVKAEPKVDKAQAKLDAKKEALNKAFKTPQPEKPKVEATDTDEDVETKIKNYEEKIKQYEENESKRAKFEADNTALLNTKQALGNKFSPAVDEKLGELIASEHYDKLKDFSPEQRMLILTQMAMGMVGETDNTLIKEVETEIKSKADLKVPELKGGTEKKLSAGEAMKLYNQTGKDEYLNIAMGVEDMLDSTIFSGRK